MPTAFLDPEEILDKLKLQEDMIAADFGCGSGGWAIPLAGKLPHGIVYAIDAQEDPLGALMKKANLHGLDNIKKIHGDVERGITPIESKSCDLVLMTNLLFQIDDKKFVFKEAARILKDTGRILLVEWTLESAFGPLQERRVSQGKAKDFAKEQNFVADQEIEAGSYHYGILFSKINE